MRAKNHANKHIVKHEVKKYNAKSKVAQNLRTSTKVNSDVVKQKVKEFLGAKFTPNHTTPLASNRNSASVDSIVGFGSFGDHSPTRRTIHLWHEAAKKTKFLTATRNVRSSLDNAVANLYLTKKENYDMNIIEDEESHIAPIAKTYHEPNIVAENDEDLVYQEAPVKTIMEAM